MNQNENQNQNLSNTNRIDINSLPANKTGSQIKQEQNETRNKYQTNFNVYHDKKQINKDSRTILCILGLVIILIILILLFQ